MIGLSVVALMVGCGGEQQASSPWAPGLSEVGAPPATLTLELSDAIVGAPLTLQLTGADPAEDVHFFRSGAEGLGPCLPSSVCLGGW